MNTCTRTCIAIIILHIYHEDLLNLLFRHEKVYSCHESLNFLSLLTALSKWSIFLNQLLMVAYNILIYTSPDFFNLQ